MINWIHATWTCVKCGKEAVVADDGKPFGVIRKSHVGHWVGMILDLDASLGLSMSWETKQRPPLMERVESAVCRECALGLVAGLLEPFLKEAVMASQTT